MHRNPSHQQDNLLRWYGLSKDEAPLWPRGHLFAAVVKFFLVYFHLAGRFSEKFSQAHSLNLSSHVSSTSSPQVWQRQRQQLPTRPSQKPWRSRRSSWRRWAATTVTPTTMGATGRTETSAPASVRVAHRHKHTRTHAHTNTRTTWLHPCVNSNKPKSHVPVETQTGTLLQWITIFKEKTLEKSMLHINTTYKILQTYVRLSQ